MANDQRLIAKTMADKKSLIKFCRYYKGETDTELTGNDGMFWNCERVWVEDTIKQSSTITSALNDYLSVGLRTFEMYDDTPATLKAALFNRFAKYFSGSIFEAATAFKVFYNEQYIKQ